MSPYEVHNVRFFDLKPRSGHCLAFCAERNLLALSRSDSSIEIWNFSGPYYPVLERSISGFASEDSIEALAWGRPISKSVSNPKGWRLFSAGLHGLVIEHHLEAVEVESDDQVRRNSWPVTSGAGWCMKFNEETGKLAVGTEEGFVCLFDVTVEGLDFDKVLDKQEGRVLCLDWHKNGTHIVTGSLDTIRVWDAVSGHPILRMSTGRVEKNRPTIVWSVAILDDFTIVSGDSRGKTSFWNGKVGTLVDSYQSHKADVLCVAVDQLQKVVYTSGVDPVLIQFQAFTKEGQRRKWVYSMRKIVNTNDVRAITCITNNKVVSIGVDANLCVSPGDYLQGPMVTKCLPIPFGENVVVGSESNLVGLRKSSSIEVWKLGQAHPENVAMQDYSQGPSESSKFLALQEQPLKVLELKTKDEDPIENFHMSRLGDYVGYITGTKLRIFRTKLVPDANSESTSFNPTLQRIAIKLQPNRVPQSIHFYNSNQTDFVFLVTPGIGLKCYQISTEDFSATPIFQLLPSQMNLTSDVAKVVVNNSGTFCLVSDFDGNVVVVDLSLEKVSVRFPKFHDCPITCFALDPKTDNVIIVYANNQFVECNPKSGKLTKFFEKNLALELHNILPKQFLAKQHPTAGIVFPQGPNSNPDEIIFYDTQSIFVLDKSLISRNDPTGHPSKVPKPSGSSPKQFHRPIMRTTKKYEYLIHLGMTKGNNLNKNGPSLVAIEVKPEALELQLPPSLRQKKFGAM